MLLDHEQQLSGFDRGIEIPPKQRFNGNRVVLSTSFCYQDLMINHVEIDEYLLKIITLSILGRMQTHYVHMYDMHVSILVDIHTDFSITWLSMFLSKDHLHVWEYLVLSPSP